MPEAGSKRFSLIEKVFKTYDKSGDGFLDISELETVLKTLGTFNNHEIVAVCAALDTSKDGRVSLKEFLAWVKAPTESKEIAKAKAILAPVDDDGLKVVFYNFCGAGHSDMDGRAFLKMCKDCHLIDKNLTEKAVDLIFSNNKVKKKGQRTIGCEQFEVALELVAAKKGVRLEEVRDVVLESTRPILQGTKALPVRFYDDPKCIAREESGNNVSSSQSGSSHPRRPAPLRKSVEQQVLEAARGHDQDRLADNRTLWRTFGIDCPAGRTLKTLYQPAFRADMPGQGPRRRMPWPPEQDTYVAINSLHAMTPGLHFRNSMHLQDLCRGPHEFVPWGAAVQGDRVDTCWLKLGERFLPMEVNGTRLLKRWEGPGPHPTAASGGLVKASSLPSLRLPAKSAMGTRVLVGMPASSS